MIRAYNKPMFKPIEIFIGLRYLKAKRRNHFISFISFISIVGIALGVMALITVLSVMNGFEKELTSRILGMASHATVTGRDGALTNWQSLADKILEHPMIMSVAPYIHAEGMLTHGRNVSGTVIRGILPEQETNVSVIADKVIVGEFANLVAGEFGILLGNQLATNIGVTIGDKVTLVAPQINVTAVGILPRLKRFTVVGIFEIGMYEFDRALALMHMDDAKRLFRQDGPTGLRLKTTDIFVAPKVSRNIVAQLPDHLWVQDWTQSHANFFRALKLEKTVMFFILILIVAVAAFNIISTLIMTVTDKQLDIAVLRTLGISKKSILEIFMIQGTLIGCLGILLGVISGVCLASNIGTIIPTLEQLLGIKFLSPDIYYISDLPSDLHWIDVIITTVMSFIFCVLATIYPALRAAKTQPAEILRYE